MLACDFWVFEHTGINHKLIFEVGARTKFHYQQLACLGALIAIGWNVTFLLKLFDQQSEYSNQVELIYLVVMALNLFILFMPFKVLYYPLRRWIVRIILRTCT